MLSVFHLNLVEIRSVSALKNLLFTGLPLNTLAFKLVCSLGVLRRGVRNWLLRRKIEQSLEHTQFTLQGILGLNGNVVDGRGRVTACLLWLVDF